ncbi:Kelch repeat-containing protein [Emticicia agri]|uniref:Galactose oxidase n=1 Tax=Emticicia agri TaxID=2492393 RepID=A0A4Q5LT79_9BACT|nr:hypothetical protein [Emticicia agri]RYU92752.1 hypothetical protein EWM59_25615 [Emticicia agri]
MKRIITISLILIFLWEGSKVSAQTGIISPDGVYVPRLTTVNRNAIATPANGQLIYNTDENCFNVYQKGAWQKLSGFNPTLSDTWTPKANLPVGNGVMGFSIGSKGYLGEWEYDPATDIWTQKAAFPGESRFNAVRFSIGNKGYYGTGYYPDIFFAKEDFWEFDPIANTWTRKADFGGGARYGAVGFSIGNKGYLGGGARFDFSGGEVSLAQFQEYDPSTDTWTAKASLGIIDAVGFSIGNRGYVGTGYDSFNDDVYISKLFWEYNPDANTWTRKADFGGTARIDAAGFSIGNKGYIGLGQNKKDLWEYEPTDNTWTQKTSFGGTTINSATGFSIGKKGYVGIGGGINNFYEYDPFGPPKSITTQGNTFNGPNQLLQFNASGNIGENLNVNGDVTVTGVINTENFIAPTLLNGWVNYNTPTYVPAGYYKDVEARVHLRGSIKFGTSTSGTVLFTLPVGYRPSEVMMFAVTTTSLALGRVDIFPNGDVKVINGSSNHLCLDGISFRVN